MNRPLFAAAFGIGLAAIGWIAAGYLQTQPLALAMTLLIAAFFLMGARELWRFHQDSAALAAALRRIPTPLAQLDDWLPQVPQALRTALQLRLDGDRAALPGPAMTPFLVGLLVLLGMLGTFLGMVVTLGGTSLALERATDLQTMRDSLAAPVKGLGLAFGTSVAGVAASALLGLMAALCRRERQQLSQQLDASLGTTLRAFTAAQRREQALQLQQRQAEMLPLLVDRLQAAMAQIEQQSQQAQAQLRASQQEFQNHAEAAYRSLAESVQTALTESLAEGARLAASTLQPAVQTTMSGIARETAALHGHVTEAVQRQLDGTAASLQAGLQTVADGWAAALAQHEQRNDAATARLELALDGFGQGFEQRSAALVDRVAASHAGWQERSAAALTAQFEAIGERLDQAVRGVSAGWTQALARHEQLGDALAGQTRQAHDDAARRAEQQSSALLHSMAQAQAELQAQSAAREGERLSAWHRALETMAEALRQEWQQAGEQAARQQAQICATLEQTAGRIAAQAEAHAQATIGEIGRLVQAASEAPRAAAELAVQLRQQLSESVARDNAMLDERVHILATLHTLLESVQHTTGEQRAAIDRLVAGGADRLQQAGTDFAATIDDAGARMASAAAQVGAGAVDIASLGEAFGTAVEGFCRASDRLMQHLQRVDDTLGRAIARSDEQLAYYVAQAREVIDLSLMSQKQLLDDLQRIAGRRAAQGSEA